jgi:type IV secretion/conjugal transfer VirB4 family ATPase
MRLTRIVRDYREAGGVNSLLALWGFVDDNTFLTKAGHVGMVFRLAGVDYECLDDAERRAVVHRFEAALRVLDEHCRVYQYLCKRRIDPIDAAICEDPVVNDAIQQRVTFLNDHRDELYEVGLYLVLVYEGIQTRHPSTRLQGLFQHPRRALHEWLSTHTVLHLLERDLDRAVAQLHQKAAAFEVQLADSARPTRLGKADTFRFFRRLVNYTAADDAVLKYDTHLDYFVADSPVDCHRTHLDVGEAHVKVLTMKEPPAGTYAHLLEDLYTVPGEFIACLQWHRIPNDRMRRDIQARRRHFFNQRVSMVNYLVATDPRPEEALVHSPSDQTVTDLGQALTELEVRGHFFGECSLTVVLFDRDPQVVARAAAEAVKVMATHDGTLVAETYNLLNAWLAVVPGNSAHNLRRLALLETNIADLSFLFTLDTGARVSPHLGREALATFETRHHTPYFFNLHVDDVGHTVAVGMTGSGKSVLLKFLTTHAQKYRPNTYIFDLGDGYRKLATRLGGSYVDIGLRQRDVSINPFALQPTPENLHFLHAFVRVLLEGTDTSRLSDAEDRELYEAIENVYVLDATQRRLFTLANLLPRSLAARLSKWVDGGRYADLFDHVEDTLTVQRFQVFDFEGARAYPAVLEPLLFYVLHRVSDRLAASAEAGELTLCVMDEAWRFIQHDRLRAYVQEALKTWRKRNGAMLLATQSIEDFASADLLRTVVESCPTKLLLANPSFDRVRYADLFQLNETELDLLERLMPRRQLLLKRPGLAKVLTLNIDPRSYWLYTDTPNDNERVATMVREHGFEAGLDRLAASV